MFARVGEHARLAASDQAGPAGDPAALSDAPFAYAIADYYQTNPISRASPDDGGVLAPVRARRPCRRRSRRWRSSSCTRCSGSLILTIAETLALLVPVLIGVAYLTLAERKVLAAIQIRRGPNVVGPFGLYAALRRRDQDADEGDDHPDRGRTGSCSCWRRCSPSSLAMIAWAVIPVNDGWAIADINVGVLYLFAISSLGVYGIIIAGWASNSKYAFLGALRSAAQMVSYEVSHGLRDRLGAAVRRQPAT